MMTTTILYQNNLNLRTNFGGCMHQKYNFGRLVTPMSRSPFNKFCFFDMFERKHNSNQPILKVNGLKFPPPATINSWTQSFTFIIFFDSPYVQFNCIFHSAITLKLQEKCLFSFHMYIFLMNQWSCKCFYC